MSNNQGDSEFEASLAGLDRADDGDLGLDDLIDLGGAGSLASRLDSVEQLLSGVDSRLDQLAAGAAGDPDVAQRLDDVSEAVLRASAEAVDAAAATRAELEAVRSSQQAAMSEVQRALDASERAIARLGAQIAAVSPSAGPTGDGAPMVDLTPLLDSHEQLVAAVTAAVTSTEQAVTSQIEESRRTVVEALDDLRAIVSAPAPAPPATSPDPGIDDLRRSLGEVKDELASLSERDRSTVSETLDRVHETLLDVASGEVVGALWEEVRAMRSELGSVSAPAPAVTEGLEEAVQALAEEVRSLLDAAELVDSDPVTEVELVGDALDLEPVVTSVDSIRSEVGTLIDDFEAFKAQLTDGLLVKPGEDLTAVIEQLRIDPSVVAGPVEALGAEVAAVGADLASLRAQLSEGLLVEPSDALISALIGLQADLGDLAGLREAVGQVHARLEEGVELVDTSGVDDVRASALLADQIAALRDLVSTELEGIRAQLSRTGETIALPLTVDTSALEELVEGLRDDVAGISTRPAAPDHDREPASGWAASPSIDQDDLVAVLREEMQAARGVSDAVVDAVREELKALRRRIVVKADERVLDQAQLQFIADAVADRLAQG